MGNCWVLAIGLGGAHIGAPRDENEAVELTRSAIDQGITFLDNCWDYLFLQSKVSR